MVVEAVYGDKLENRLKDLLAYQRSNITLRIVSQHIHNTKIVDESLKDKLRRLRNRQARIVIVIDRKVLANDRKEQELMDELEEIGVGVYYKQKVHAKIILLESQSDNGLLVSSANISDTALHNSREAGIFILNDHKEVLDDIKSYTNQILGSSQ